MKKFFNFFLSLIILAAACFSSTSCLLPFKKHYKKFFLYDWVSESPAMQLNFTRQYSRDGTLIWEDVEYRFLFDYNDYSIHAFTYNLDTYEYDTFFEASGEQKNNKLYLEINSSSVPSLVGEAITLTKTEPAESFKGYQFQSADSLFYADFTHGSYGLESYFTFENITYRIYADCMRTGEYILFYEYTENFMSLVEERKDEGLLFVVTPILEGDTLTLTVIRSNIENLLGQTFVLTKVG